MLAAWAAVSAATGAAARRAIRWVAAAALAAALAPAHAHLMVAQKGTLNFSGDGAYLLLSLPVSALSGVDDDGDGLLSITELRAHAGTIESQVQAGVQLLEGGPAGRVLTLQGLLLNLAPPDEAPDAPARQVVVMGRYALTPPTSGAPDTPYAFRLRLFGRNAAEQVHDLTITRKPQAQAARFSLAHDTQPLFPTAATVFTSSLRAGAEHVLGGWDHLLFLLIVLASLWKSPPDWRRLVLTLTCFTAGHALTLVASVAGGIAVAPALVEPAIAATLVGMATLDLAQRHRGPRLSPAWHLALVFGCALIHGLGLAGGLISLGVDNSHLLWGLAGFNLGIEAAQVAVAGTAIQALGAIARWSGPAAPRRLTHAGSVLGMACGAWWLMERLAMGA